MNDLISRSEAITAIQKAYADTEGGTDKLAVWKNVGLTNALHIMQDLPPAQPEERTEERTETHACDCIERQAAIDALDKRFDSIPMEQTTEILLLRKDLRELPSAQPEVLACGEGELIAQPEIIRCRDCIAYQEGIDIDGKPFTRCNGINGSVRTYGHTLPDWYCADAERRTDGD